MHAKSLHTHCNRLCSDIACTPLFAKQVNTCEGRFTPTLTRGSDAFGKELTKNRRFGSSGLNLTFEGLLLGRAFIFKSGQPQATPVSRILSQLCQCTLWRKHHCVLQEVEGIGGHQMRVSEGGQGESFQGCEGWGCELKTTRVSVLLEVL
jgi:hypothetical protein